MASEQVTPLLGKEGLGEVLIYIYPLGAPSPPRRGWGMGHGLSKRSQVEIQTPTGAKRSQNPDFRLYFGIETNPSISTNEVPNLRKFA
ncbi:MAG: hypothetical protein ACYTBZ_16740 [Planctomycetota bacterium]